MLLESDSFFVDLSARNACTWLGVPAYSILVQIWLSRHTVLGILLGVQSIFKKYMIATWRTVKKISQP